MRVTPKGALALLLSCFFVMPTISQEYAKAPLTRTVAFHESGKAESQTDFHPLYFAASLHHQLSFDDLLATHSPLELVDALVHVHSARNATAMRDLREITGSKFDEYVSHNTFAIVAPAGVLAKCVFFCSGARVYTCC